MKYDFSKYRTYDIERSLAYLEVRPLDVMVTGVTGAGKSTTLNAIFQKYVAKVGEGVDPETMELQSYRLNDYFRIWDTPGLGDNIQQDKIHQRKIESLLKKEYLHEGRRYGFIDLVMVIINGSSRDLGTTFHLLNDVIVPNISSHRILVVINKADFAMKGHHWNQAGNYPDWELSRYLSEQENSVQSRIKEATGATIWHPVSYSAVYGYHIQDVFDMLVDHIPSNRRRL